MQLNSSTGSFLQLNWSTGRFCPTKSHCLCFLFPSHARALVALPPSPLLLVGLSRGVGHPFSKDPP